MLIPLPKDLGGGFFHIIAASKSQISFRKAFYFLVWVEHGFPTHFYQHGAEQIVLFDFDHLHKMFGCPRNKQWLLPKLAMQMRQTEDEGPICRF